MVDFRGIDPVGLRDLAWDLQARATGLGPTAGEVSTLLRAHDRLATADQVVATLSRVARWAIEDAVDLRRRAEIIADAQAIVATPGAPWTVAQALAHDADFALVAGFGLRDWKTARRRWLEGPSIVDVLGTPQGRLPGMFAELSPYAVSRLVFAAPEIVGRLDGAPPAVRYAANAILLTRAIDDAEQQSAELADEIAMMRHDFTDVLVDPFKVGEREAAEYELEQLSERVERWRLWREEERQLLLFDPAGDGRVVEVFGDLDTASHVAIVIPGVGNDLDNFGPLSGGGFRARAAALRDEASQLDAAVATVAWLGYDPPDGTGAVLTNAARDGDSDLVEFVSGLVVAGDVHVTVIGHSYGSLVAGLAAGEGLAADELVFVGSPGTGLDHATSAELAPGGDVWAGLAAWDPIGAAIDPSAQDAWDWVLSVPGRHLRDMLVSGEATVQDLWHGRNPVHGSFGAFEFTTDGATGHSEYFEPGTASLANMAAIVAGLPERVELIDGPRFQAAGGGGSW
jgi:pimeloyl-ACP methyl ester carboxylesterase